MCQSESKFVKVVFVSYLTLCSKDKYPMVMGFVYKNESYGDLTILVININLSI